MSDVTYPVDAATLPQGSCPASYQELADLLASIYSVTVNTSNTGIVVSATKPADTTVVWKQLGTDGRPVRDYYFVGGIWLSRHTMESGSIIIWDGALPDFTTFDGGDANPLSAVSGPMWEEVTELRARFPVGAGTLPSATVLAVGDTGGEEKHTLTLAELPTALTIPHQQTSNNPAEPYLQHDDTDEEDIGVNADAADNTVPGSSTPANNMPPYYTVYFLRRTARQYFAVS
jgi:hypothetical protein